jgi:hypothetical protein
VQGHVQQAISEERQAVAVVVQGDHGDTPTIANPGRNGGTRRAANLAA